MKLSTCFLSLALLSVGVLAGCGEKPFLKVNGQAITRDEYIHALEQLPVPTGNNTAQPAERIIMDQLIGRKVVQAEATRLGVLPSDDEINRVFRVQKELFENAQPGKKYEEELQKQGSTPEVYKEGLRSQLAEAAVLAKVMNLGDDEVRRYYSERKEQFGLPARTQFRLVLLPGTSPLVKEAGKLSDPKNFTEKTARDLNVLQQLKAVGGLQILANTAIPGQLMAQFQQTPEGQVFGPVTWPSVPGSKAWVKIEKRMAQYSVPEAEAMPLARARLAQERIVEQKYIEQRNSILKKKLDASVEVSDAAYSAVWEDMKKSAIAAGMGQTAPTVPTGGGVPAPAGGAPAPK